MFEKNEFVVHNGNVCRVEDITTLDFKRIDKNKKYYVMDSIYENGKKIYTPVDNEKVQLRPVLTRAEAEVLIDEIPELDTIWIPDEKEREKQYKEAMKKYDCMEWIRIIRTVYQRKLKREAEGKKITYTDEKYFNEAQDLLYGELSISLDIPKKEVETFINRRMELIDSGQTQERAYIGE